MIWMIVSLPFILPFGDNYFQRMNIFNARLDLKSFEWDNRNWAFMEGYFEGEIDLKYFINFLKFLHLFLIFYFFAFKFCDTENLFDEYRINIFKLTHEKRLVSKNYITKIMFLC